MKSESNNNSNSNKSLLKQCVDMLKTDDVRQEIKHLFSPVTDLILYEIYPYIYLIIFLVLLLFILILVMLTLLLLFIRGYNPRIIHRIVG